MTKTEYIGARYAPIFADPVEWSSTRAYEPLTIVIYDGDSYTSKRAVPIGIEITDTEYWVKTSTGRADISGIEERLMLLGGDIESVDRKYELKFPVTVANGGTGGTTAAQARASLDVPATGGSIKTLYDVEQTAGLAYTRVDSVMPRITDVYENDELWTDDALGVKHATIAEIGDVILINLTCGVVFNNSSALDILELPNNIELRGLYGVIYDMTNNTYRGHFQVGSSTNMVAVNLFDLAFSGSIRATAWGVRNSLTIQPD